MATIAPKNDSTTDETGKAKRESISGAAIIYRFYGQQIVYPGQGGLNPCWYCKWFYKGRFTLQMGCLFVGCALITYGVIWLAIGATRIYDCISGNNYEAAADETIKNLILANAILMLIDSLLFILLPAFLLITASCKLYIRLCFAYTIIMILGMAFSIVEAIVIIVLITRLPEKFADASNKLTLIFLLMAFKVLDEAFRLYSLLCGYGLLLQIRSGEYDIPSPPFIASTYAIGVEPTAADYTKIKTRKGSTGDEGQKST